MTFAKFERLPNSLEGVRDEPRHGERLRRESAQDSLPGVPGIVIEILSPPNARSGMLDPEKICLENGGKEFWMVDPEPRLAKVSTPDRHAMTHRAGQEIRLSLCNGGRTAVDAIFAQREG
jgi:Uma2 family endonuclease